MQVTLETLQQHAPDGIRVAIPGLLQSTLWSLEAMLRLIQLPTFDELVEAWRVAGDNINTADIYRRLAQSVRAESYVSEIDLELIIKWYYREFIAEK